MARITSILPTEFFVREIALPWSFLDPTRDKNKVCDEAGDLALEDGRVAQDDTLGVRFEEVVLGHD